MQIDKDHQNLIKREITAILHEELKSIFAKENQYVILSHGSSFLNADLAFEHSDYDLVLAVEQKALEAVLNMENESWIEPQEMR